MKILIRLPNWLGDVVMSSAFVAAVRAFYPDAAIDVIVKKELVGAANLIPGLREVFPFSKQEHKGLSGVYAFGKKLRDGKYDIFFNLPESISSQVLAFATKAKKKVGFSKEGSLFLLTDRFKKPKNVHRVEEYVSLAEQFSGKKADKTEVKLNIVRPAARPADVIIINFNSEASSRRMPLEKARSLINLLTESFKNIRFAFVGSPKEASFVERVINRAANRDRIENLAGKTDLPELAKLFSTASAVLTTDSGPAHLANAVGAPTVVLFGAGNEFNTAPYNKQRLTVLRAGVLDCEPCVKNTCKLYGVPKCMELIDGMEIIVALVNYIPTIS